MLNLLWPFVIEESGQDLAEYALLLALIAAACIGGVTTLGINMNLIYVNLSTNFPAGS
jgi:pilus assembly protein Flp/PilA